MLELVPSLVQECTDEIPKGFSPALSDLAQAFLKKLRSFHGRPDFDDDLTLLWVRRLPGSDAGDLPPEGHENEKKGGSRDIAGAT